ASIPRTCPPTPKSRSSSASRRAAAPGCPPASGCPEPSRASSRCAGSSRADPFGEPHRAFALPGNPTMLRKSSAATNHGSGLAGRGGRHAMAAVELAIVLLFILGPLTIGMFELARGMMVKQVLCAAARKGCRTGVLHQYGNTDIINDATNVMQDNGFDVTL